MGWGCFSKNSGLENRSKHNTPQHRDVRVVTKEENLGPKVVEPESPTKNGQPEHIEKASTVKSKKKPKKTKQK